MEGSEQQTPQRETHRSCAIRSEGKDLSDIYYTTKQNKQQRQVHLQHRFRANLNRDTKIKKMLLGPIFCISHIRAICCFQLHIFVAPKCVSVCIAADAALSNTNFINLIYVM
jgi:hypothetical protein